MAGGLIPEQISAEMWAPPPTFDAAAMAAAARLMGVVGQINGILDGQQANAGVLLAAWASPTGERAVGANMPYQTWLTDMAHQITHAAEQITAAGADFSAARTATPHPVAFAANHTEFVHLMHQVWNPFVWPAILRNRIEYVSYCVETWTAYGTYGLATATTVQSIPSLPVPPIAATPNLSIGAGLAAPIGQAMQGVGALQSADAALRSVSSGAAQPASALSQMLSSSGDTLTSPGDELAQASSLGALPSMASMPTSGLSSAAAGPGGLGSAEAGSGSLLAMPAAGGTVTAALRGGGAGLSGLGAAVTRRPLSAPRSWASTANAANPTPKADQVAVSRLARAASAPPATAGAMGAPGAMAPAARQASSSASASERERGLNDVLTTAAVLYRPPADMPVVTGAAGAQFVAGEEN